CESAPRMRKKGRKQVKIAARCARAAAALICAYALALTTILSAWSGLALASPADSGSAVICAAHGDGQSVPAPANPHRDSLLCSTFCALAGWNAHVVLAIQVGFAPIPSEAGAITGSSPG